MTTARPLRSAHLVDFTLAKAKFRFSFCFRPRMEALALDHLHKVVLVGMALPLTSHVYIPIVYDRPVSKGRKNCRIQL